MIKKIIVLAQIEGLIILGLVYSFYQGKLSQPNFIISVLITSLLFGVLLFLIARKRI